LKTKKELIEEIWRNSNLTMRQAEEIIEEAMELGQISRMQVDGGNVRAA
jgi:nucleoid DNA-binding protein